MGQQHCMTCHRPYGVHPRLSFRLGMPHFSLFHSVPRPSSWARQNQLFRPSSLQTRSIRPRCRSHGSGASLSIALGLHAECGSCMHVAGSALTRYAFPLAYFTYYVMATMRCFIEAPLCFNLGLVLVPMHCCLINRACRVCCMESSSDRHYAAVERTRLIPSHLTPDP
jgi:hypothetical protein